MTAEVAILNKTAVALAADSAVTIRVGDDVKIYNSLKLFSLCSSSIGIMIYNNAEFTGVPWETIIKQYRKDSASKTFPTLEDCGDDFISYLTNNRALFSEELQRSCARNIIRHHFALLAKQIDDKVKASTRNNKIGASTIKRITRQSIAAWHDKLEKQEDWKSIAAGLDQRVLSVYEKDISNLIDRVFTPLPLNQRLKKRLRTIAGWLLTKNVIPLGNDFPQVFSGVVIAGFGETDIYPALVTFHVESLVLNELRYSKVDGKSTRITADNSSVVIAFAQEDVVAGFMEGIDRNFHAHMLYLLFDVFNEYAEEIAKNLPGFTAAKKRQFISDLKKVSIQLVKGVNDSMQTYKWDHHIESIVQAVGALPKEELASMASALVNLTSTKRRVTMDLETVGGPIDVAVISKGDGFIWVNRKHYFEPDKNPHFFSRYR